MSIEDEIKNDWKWLTKDSIEKAIGKILYNAAKEDFLERIKVLKSINNG